MTQTETRRTRRPPAPPGTFAPHRPQPPPAPVARAIRGGHPLGTSIPVSASGRPQPDPGAVEATRLVNPATLRLRRRDPLRALSQAADASKKDANARFRKLASPGNLPDKIDFSASIFHQLSTSVLFFSTKCLHNSVFSHSNIVNNLVENC